MNSEEILYGHHVKRETSQKEPLQIKKKGCTEFFDPIDGRLFKIILSPETTIQVKKMRRGQPRIYNLYTQSGAVVYVTDDRILHRHHQSGPAIQYNDGSWQYWQNGQLHRPTDFGPATYYNHGLREWWFEGQRHRPMEDGPAVLYDDETREFWVNDKKHADPLYLAEIKDQLKEPAKLIIKTMFRLKRETDAAGPESENDLAYNWPAKELSREIKNHNDILLSAQSITNHLLALEKEDLVYSLVTVPVRWAISAHGRAVADAL